ncbi:helix-turn-helix domain-containing protein [Nitrospirillum iridis]|uniref:Winged helix-turn-helix domain-containing protein n=1 Tax=Nitrospirillum iridis TaxID=765888 RepID=A0A7X0EEI3_9PROT|nr:helix-turn-helix domain-containing protein [Nitrospirillum iridis]MBB6253050.1 hypothetical protein [Nitrospirillum iridis]
MTQLDLLARHFRVRGTLTPLEASHLYGVASFHRRIADLAARGWEFTKTRKRDLNGTPYVEYRVVTHPLVGLKKAPGVPMIRRPADSRITYA